MMTEEKDLSLQDKKSLLNKLVKDYKRKSGDEKVVFGFAEDLDLDYGYIKAPIVSLSTLMAQPGQAEGGFPRGTYSIIGGPEGSGKSTLVWQTIAMDQQEDPNSIWVIAAPEPLDVNYMKLLGVDMERIIVIKDGLMEDVMQKVIELSKTNAVKGFVIDSIGALTPRGEVYDSKGKEHELEHTGMLDLQRKLGQFFRMSNNWISRSKAACILITHVYQDPNSNGRYVLKGGNSMKHFSYVRLKLSKNQDTGTKRSQQMPDGNMADVMIGKDVLITLEKSKQNANEGKTVVVPYRYGIGLDSVESTIAIAINFDVIKRGGSWFTYIKPDNSETKFQGRPAISEYFRSNQEEYKNLLSKVTVRLSELEKSKDLAKDVPVDDSVNIDE